MLQRPLKWNKAIQGLAEPRDPLRKRDTDHREASVARTLFSAGREREEGRTEGKRERNAVTAAAW